MNKIMTLVKKEVLDVLRDKKTLIIMVVVPILLYPAMIIGMVLIMNMISQSQAEEEHIIVYEAEDRTYIDNLRIIYEDNKDEYNTKVTFLSVSKENEGENFTKFGDIWVDFIEKQNTLQVTVQYTSTKQDSNYTENILEDLIEKYEEQILSDNLMEKGLNNDFLHPIHYEANDSVTETESLGMNLGGYIGMLLIVTIMLGSFYPAIDVTTGEKERGTLETLLTLPVTNFQMIMSKFIAVSLFSCVTAILSLISLGASTLFLVNSVTVGADNVNVIGVFDISLLIGYLPILLIVMIVTALLITAFCMCFCIFAKSFKEANNYITPVMLIVMFASMVSMLPSIKLNYNTAIIPIVNVSLLLRQVAAQQLDLVLAGITISINLCYSILTIWILSKMYDSENILFTDGFQSFRLFQKRSEIKKGSIPQTGDLILCTVVVFLLIMYVGSAVSVRSTIGGAVVNQLIILAVPLIISWYMKVDIKKLFSCRMPGIKGILGGLILYIGTYFLLMVVSSILTVFFPESVQNLEATFDGLLELSVGLLLFVIALMPAVGEELLFRGFIFGGLRSKYSIGISIVVSAIIFGIFHMSLVKLLPTAMLGACFAYITYCTGSIYIGMILHFVNNFVSIFIMKYPQFFVENLPILTKENLAASEIMGIIVIGVICTIAGIYLLKRNVSNR